MILPNSKEVTCDNKVDLKFQIKNRKTQSLIIEAKALKSRNNMLILGTQFLLSENAIINYSEGIINLNGIKFEMPKHSKIDIDAEKLLIKAQNYLNYIESKVKAGQRL